jgi:hypothetical protein
MKRIRMLKNVLTHQGDFRMGRSYEVGDHTGQVKLHLAESWTRFGQAEEDKSLNGAPETKEKKGRAKKE